MFLVIDNTDDNQIAFSGWLDKKFIHQVFDMQDNQDLLVCMDTLLVGLKIIVQDITGIGVVVGAGKFTATRLAVTLANTLAFSLKIPVISLEKNFNQEQAFMSLGSAVAGSYILPVYSAGPHLYGQTNK